MKVLAKKTKMAMNVKAASGFDYPATLVGTSKWVGSDGKPVTIYYDPATGQAGLDVANYVLSKIDDLMTYCDWAFGVKGHGGNVIVAPDFGGAYHYGCDFAGGGDWYESLSGNGTTLGLVMAEVVESYMGFAGKGWNCGGSGGEGLSRFLAEVATNGAQGDMSAYAAGPSWDGTDWISSDQGTDQDYPSTGCAVLYCWWMMKLGYTVAQLVQAGEPDGTLKSNYAAITGKPATQAFADFKAAVAAAGAVNDDNPFQAANPPYPVGGNPPPPPVCPAGQHWDPVANACVPDGPPPPPPPASMSGTVHIPALAVKTLLGTHYTIPTDVPVTVFASNTDSITIPPILLKVIKLICSGVIPLPPAWAPWVALICAIIPPGESESVKLTTVQIVAILNALPPWLLALLKLACANIGSLPASWQPWAGLICSFLPAASGKPCGCS